MGKKSRQRGRSVWFLFLAALLLLSIAMNLCIGSVEVPPGKVLGILMQGASGGDDAMASQIIRELRMPRLIAAAMLGGALAVSGFLLQTFFSNPIAGPFVLGISSGAKLFVALAMIGGLRFGRLLSSGEMVLSAFLGAMCSMGFIMLLARQTERMSALVICGIMIGYICSAATDFLVTFADDANIVNLHNWSKGSFSGIGWDKVAWIVPVVVVSWAAAFLLSKPMGALLMGEGFARNVGVDLRFLRICLVLVSSILSACVTAFAGPISFLGVAVPQLMKRMFATAKPIILIPACFLGGGVFCLFCDLLARTLFAPTELSISTVTAFFGAPVVIWVLVHRTGDA